MKQVFITFLVVDKKKKKPYKRNIRKNRFEASVVEYSKSWQQEVKATIIQSGSRQQCFLSLLPLPPPTVVS